jgi:integrase/recombinase XerD
MARDHRQACALVAGPLAGHAPGFAEHLTSLGYSDGAVHQQLLLLAEVSRWLQQQLLDGGQLSPAGADRFAAEVGRGRKRLVSARSLRPLLGYLHDQGVVPGAWPPGPGTGGQTTLTLQYREYLRDVRGLSDATVRCYVSYTAGFLALLGERLGEVSGTQVLAAVSRQAGQYPAASMRAVVNADRALLRFLHRAGLTTQPLEAAVPSAARRPASVPARLDAAMVSALLASCDRRLETGARDYAVLMLLKRYGVRPVEVCRLELTDVRWRSGELVVRGKGGRAETLPLMHDAGEAVAGYLQIRRAPPPGVLAVFLAAAAPPRPMCPQSVYGIVARACARAGVRQVSPRSFRHGLGCDLLAAGASLAEISDVLRHKNVATTAIYARADLAALVPLVRPWPASAAGPDAGPA